MSPRIAQRSDASKPERLSVCDDREWSQGCYGGDRENRSRCAARQPTQADNRGVMLVFCHGAAVTTLRAGRPRSIVCRVGTLLVRRGSEASPMAQDHQRPRPRKAARSPEYPAISALAVAASLYACGGQHENAEVEPGTTGGADGTSLPASTAAGGATSATGGAAPSTGGSSAPDRTVIWGMPPQTYVQGGTSHTEAQGGVGSATTGNTGTLGGFYGMTKGMPATTYVRGGSSPGGPTGGVSGSTRSTTKAVGGFYGMTMGKPATTYVRGGTSNRSAGGASSTPVGGATNTDTSDTNGSLSG